MSNTALSSFDPRSQRGYDYDAVETFPWPVVAGYEDMHGWMDEGLAVYAAWQVRDVWEALLKFLGTLAVADRLAAVDDSQTSKLLATLLNPEGLSLGHWPTLIELALKDGRPTLRLQTLCQLLFPNRNPKLLPLFIGGDQSRSFIPWRNRRFGHGVLGRDLDLYAAEART